mmetsp:Transcript_76519/g.153634  ORF Transcript_76519/g.153634 Transcript_76519/m.153634 type:complete len:420 (+) Transcript_76519:74-1333(+)
MVRVLTLVVGAVASVAIINIFLAVHSYDVTLSMSTTPRNQSPPAASLASPIPAAPKQPQLRESKEDTADHAVAAPKREATHAVNPGQQDQDVYSLGRSTRNEGSGDELRNLQKKSGNGGIARSTESKAPADAKGATTQRKAARNSSLAQAEEEREEKGLGMAAVRAGGGGSSGGSAGGHAIPKAARKDEKEDVDDIVDPMVRRADAGQLSDVVPVLCNSTKGLLAVEVFPDSWGSLGAARFLQLVDARLFTTKVALHRAVKGFIIQFGTPGDPAWSAKHKGEFPSIKDDPQWLPLGPLCGAKQKHKRKTCLRHRKGFLSFAGGGPNSRRIEMFVGLADTGHGGDGKQATHEVPFGRVVPASFPVLDQLYTGYGEMQSFGGRAPPSGRIGKLGVGWLQEEFPLLDFITGCERTQQRWSPS